MIASALLVGIVTAVSGAIIAGQQNALIAQERIAGTLAAEALLGRVLTQPYDELTAWHGYREEVGEMVDEHGAAMPDSFNVAGREVHVESTMSYVSSVDVLVRGRTVTVRAFNYSGEVLVELRRYVVEPLSE